MAEHAPVAAPFPPATLTARQHHQLPANLLQGLVFAVAFVVAAVLGRWTIPDGAQVSLVWPAAGVSVAWLVVRRSGRLAAVDWAVFAGATVVVNAATGASLALALGFVLANTVQVLGYLLAADLLHAPGALTVHPDGGPAQVALDDGVGYLRFLLASLVSCLASSLVGPLVLSLAGAAWTPLAVAVWLLRNLAGIVVVGSVAFTFWPRRGGRLTERWRELAVLVAATFALYLLVFRADDRLPLSFLLLTVSAWAGARFGPRLAALHGLLVAALAACLTLAGWGPFAAVADVADRVVVLEVFVMVAQLVGVSIALRHQERARIAEGLRAARADTADRAELLRTILDTMGDGVSVIGDDGAVLMRNRTGRQLLGEVAGSSPGVVRARQYGLFRLDGTPMPDAELPYRRALRGEVVTGFPMLVRNQRLPDGRVFRFSARRLRYGAEERAVVVYHDVTEEIRQRRELEDFAAVVSHDLKNPLYAVVGWSEHLRDLAEDGAAIPAAVVLDHLDRVERATHRMGALIDGMLSTARAEVDFTPHLVDVRRLAEEVLERQTVVLDRTTVLDFRGEPQVWAEPFLLTQLLENLIGNALKYTPADRPPELHLRVEVDPIPGGGRQARLEVSDVGMGIPEGQHERIFDTFRRATDVDVRGTGLGLAISKRIVERHGGTIRARSNGSGPGTTVVVTLPYPDEPEPAAP